MKLISIWFVAILLVCVSAHAVDTPHDSSTSQSAAPLSTISSGGQLIGDLEINTKGAVSFASPSAQKEKETGWYHTIHASSGVLTKWYIAHSILLVKQYLAFIHPSHHFW